MSSESGLKQRRTVISQESRFANSNSSTDHQNQSDNDNNNEENNDEYDADSKETRLTLMEEILLLGLKDREVQLFSTFFFKRLKFFKQRN